MSKPRTLCDRILSRPGPVHKFKHPRMNPQIDTRVSPVEMPCSEHVEQAHRYVAELAASEKAEYNTEAANDRPITPAPRAVHCAAANRIPDERDILARPAIAPAPKPPSAKQIEILEKFGYDPLRYDFDSAKVVLNDLAMNNWATPLDKPRQGIPGELFAQNSKLSENSAPLPYITKDSGERATFAGGMVRDVDTDKTKWHKVADGPMLRRWAELLTRGAVKYPDEQNKPNWMKAQGEEEYNRFRQSAFRHFMQWYNGDPDEDHAAAVFFNINGAEYVKNNMDFQQFAAEEMGRVVKVA